MSGAWIVQPERTAFSHLNLGANGSLILPLGLDIDLGPIPVFAVTAQTAPGTYGFGCRTLDLVTGEPRVLDEAPFEVQ